MTEPTPQTITKEQKRAALIFGAVMMVFGVAAMLSILFDPVGLFARPQQVTLEEAAAIATNDNTYVEISEAEVLCDRLDYREGRSSSTGTTETRYTDVWLVNADESVGVFASYSGRLTCEDIENQPVSGFMTQVGRSLPSTAGRAPLDSDATYLELCAYCGTSNSIALVIVFTILIGLGGLMVYGALTRPVAPPVSDPDDA